MTVLLAEQAIKQAALFLRCAHGLATASWFAVARCSDFAAASRFAAIAVAVVLLVEDATDLVAKRTLWRAARSHFAAAGGSNGLATTGGFTCGYGVATSVAAVGVMAKQAESAGVDAAADQQGRGQHYWSENTHRRVSKEGGGRFHGRPRTTGRSRCFT